MLLAQPHRPRARSEDTQHFSQLAAQTRAVQARLQLFHAGEWHQLLRMAEALWPLEGQARGAQAPAGQDDATSEEQRRRADAVVSKCATTGTAPALQLLMSPGVAPSSARTVELTRKAVCRHEGRSLPARSWVADYVGQAAAPDARTLTRALKQGARG
eukprot:4059556-Karenia_brevis.AAC.1